MTASPQKFTASATNRVTPTVERRDFHSHEAAKKWVAETPGLELLCITSAWQARKHATGAEADALRAAGFLAPIQTPDNTPVSATGIQGPHHATWTRHFPCRLDLEQWLRDNIDTVTCLAARYPRGASPSLTAARRRRDASIKATKPPSSSDTYKGTKARSIRMTASEWADFLLVGSTRTREMITAEASRLRAAASPTTHKSTP